jgi:hypothetical protein
LGICGGCSFASLPTGAFSSCVVFVISRVLAMSDHLRRSVQPFHAPVISLCEWYNPPKPVTTTHPSLMLRIQPVWHNAGSSMNSCQTVPRPSGSVRTYPGSGIADIESTERYRRMRWVMMIGWGIGCCLCLTCEMHSCSRAPRGGKLLSGAGGMKVGSWQPSLGFVFRFRRKRVEA